MADIQSTCSVDYCNKPVASKQMCDRHYRRQKETGTPHRTCKTCLAEIHGDPKGKVVYCSDKCATCSIPECGKAILSNGMCSIHYHRKLRGYRLEDSCETCGLELKKYSGQAKYCSDECKPRCKEMGCERPYRYSSGYCSMHGVSYLRNGKPTGKYSWRLAADSYDCLACGENFKAGRGSRKFCSASCQQLHLTYGGNIPPLSFDCIFCGDYVVRDRFAKKYQRGDKKFCDRCRTSRQKRHKSSAGYLAKRDGNECKLCGELVDMSLRFPNKMAGSVDHIVPVALGGGHEESNLQLAHYSCNSRKQARMVESIPPAL